MMRASSAVVFFPRVRKTILRLQRFGFGFARVPCDGLGLPWYKAVAGTPTAGLTALDIPLGPCVMAQGRRAVGQRLKSAVVGWCAASTAWGWLRPSLVCHM